VTGAKETRALPGLHQGVSGSHAGCSQARRLILFAFTVIAMAALSACTFPFLGDDFSGSQENYRREVDRVLTVNSKGQVLVDGEVSMLGQSCNVSEASCHIVMTVEGVVVSVYYRSGPAGSSCRNPDAANQATELRIGDHVRVFGEYFEIGNISLCGSDDYYIKRISADP